MRKNKIISVISEIVELYFTRHVSRAASSLAYFLILTFFPILICINAFISMLELDANAIFNNLDGIIPHSALGILLDYIGSLSADNSGGMLTIGLIMTVTFASAAIRQLMTVMEEIYDRKKPASIRRFLFSILFSILFLITIYAAMYTMLTSSRLFADVLGYLGLSNPFDEVKNLSYLMVFGLILLFILLIYRMTAPDGHPRPPVLPGAILASAALIIASMIFSNMMGASSRYSLVYGTMSSVIILLVWLYLCGTILILGSVVNYVWFAHRKKT